MRCGAALAGTHARCALIAAADSPTLLVMHVVHSAATLTLGCETAVRSSRGDALRAFKSRLRSTMSGSSVGISAAGATSPPSSARAGRPAEVGERGDGGGDEDSGGGVLEGDAPAVPTLDPRAVAEMSSAEYRPDARRFDMWAEAFRAQIRQNEEERRQMRTGSGCPELDRATATGDARRAPAIRAALLRGIPDSVRGKAWALYSGAAAKARAAPPHLFSRLLAVAEGRVTQAVIDLDRDLPRTGFAAATEEGKASLRRVLTVYSLYNPAVGYLQGMNFIGALLLKFVDEVRASLAGAAAAASLTPRAGGAGGCVLDPEQHPGGLSARLPQRRHPGRPARLPRV